MNKETMAIRKSAKRCADCRAWQKAGGIGFCCAHTQRIIDANPQLKALQAKGKALLGS